MSKSPNPCFEQASFSPQNSETAFLNFRRFSVHSSCGILVRNLSNEAQSPSLKNETTHLMNAILIMTGICKTIDFFAFGTPRPIP